MADIIPAGFAQCLIPLQHNELTRPAAITFGIESGLEPQNTFLVDEVFEKFEAQWADKLDAQVTAGPMVASFGQSDGTANPVPGVVTFQGTNPGNAVAPNSAVLMRKLTGRGGRRGRGRMFIPWMVDDANVNEAGRITTVEIADFSSRGTGWLQALAAPGPTFGATPMVLLHSVSDPDTQNPTPPGDPDEVTSMICDPIIGSQRRRLGR